MRLEGSSADVLIRPSAGKAQDQRSIGRRLLIAWVFAAFVFTLHTVVATAETWQGKIVEEDGIAHVSNPATPIVPPETIKLDEVWRLGGDSEADEEFFGVIVAVDTDAAGNVYLLDRQLSEVRIFGSDGSYVRTIGQEGEGPGEFRSPTGLFLTQDGNVAVMQSRPGKIVLLTPEGVPAGEFPLPEIEGKGRVRLASGRRAGSSIVLQTLSMTMRPPKGERTIYLSAYDADGKESARFFEQTREINFAAPEFNERESMPLIWTVGPSDRIYGVTDLGRYAIRVWRSDGTEERVIERDYPSRKRTPEEMEKVKSRFVFHGRRMAEVKMVLSETDPDVIRIYPRPDGGIWVQTSRGTRDAADGTLGTFDVFDPEGRFLKEVTLVGQGDAEEDRYFFLGDRIYVVTQYLSAITSMFGGSQEDGSSDEEDVDLMPMEVICYRLDSGDGRSASR